MVRVKGANIGSLGAEAKRRVKAYRDQLQVKVDSRVMRLSRANELDRQYVEKMEADFPKKTIAKTPRSRRKSVGATRVAKPDKVAAAKVTKAQTAPKPTKVAVEKSTTMLPTVKETKEPPQEILTPKATLDKQSGKEKQASTKQVTTSKSTPAKATPSSLEIVDQVIVAWLVLSAFIIIVVELEIILVHQPLENPKSMLSPYLPPEILAEALHRWEAQYDPLILHRPTWLKAKILFDLLVQLPFISLAVPAFMKGDKSIAKFGIVASVVMLSTSCLVLAEQFASIDSKLRTPNPLVTLAVYSGNIVMPCVVLARCLAMI